jgi:hypothetical protein
MRSQRLESRGTLTQAKLRPKGVQALEGGSSIGDWIAFAIGCVPVSQDPGDGLRGKPALSQEAVLTSAFRCI